METPNSMPERHIVSISQLPDATKREMDFLESSFFQNPDHRLPTPTQVKALSTDISTTPKPEPIIFENPNIFVKFGLYVTIAEAQCLWIIRQVFRGKIPVPELFGWRIDDEGHVFIYMELIQGKRLADRWDGLDSVDKGVLRDQLCDIVGCLRQLEQDPSDKFIGSINRQPPLDYVFELQPGGRPFLSIKDFNDWFASLVQQRLPPSLKYKDPYRHILPDDGAIKFTHADLHRANIMVSSDSPIRILGIVDWEQSGWYPDFWEYCKAHYTCWCEDEWRVDFFDKFLLPRMDEFLVFSEYTMSIGAV